MTKGKKARASTRQCPATCTGGKGRYVTVVFCQHNEGHAGPHKGYRKTWPNEAEKVEEKGGA